MATVLCTRVNASEEISGVKFKQVENGMLSEEISDEQAAEFVLVGGYELVGGGEPRKETKAEEKARLKAEAKAKEEAEERAAAEAQAQAEAEAAAAPGDNKE